MATPKFSSALRIVRKFFPAVATVKDGSSAIRIKVTGEDEKKSRKKDHNECALAVACKRMKHLDGVIISRTTAYLVKDRTATRYYLPESVQKEIVAFDRGGGFSPGEYILKPHQKPLGEHSGGRETGNGASNGPSQVKHYTVGVRTVLGGKAAARAS